VGATLPPYRPIHSSKRRTGRLAGLGQPAARSDVDLVVIKSLDVALWSVNVDYCEGVQVQVIAGPPRQFDRWLELDRPQGTVLRKLAAGRLLFDRGGLGRTFRPWPARWLSAARAVNRPQILSRRFTITRCSTTWPIAPQTRTRRAG